MSRNELPICLWILSKLYHFSCANEAHKIKTKRERRENTDRWFQVHSNSTSSFSDIPRFLGIKISLERSSLWPCWVYSEMRDYMVLS